MSVIEWHLSAGCSGGTEAPVVPFLRVALLLQRNMAYGSNFAENVRPMVGLVPERQGEGSPFSDEVEPSARLNRAAAVQAARLGARSISSSAS